MYNNGLSNYEENSNNENGLGPVLISFIGTGIYIALLFIIADVLVRVFGSG